MPMPAVPTHYQHTQGQLGQTGQRQENKKIVVENYD